MLNTATRFIRDRWHPLWRLRRLAAFRWVQQRLDRTIYVKLPDTNLRVAVKMIRDAAWLVGSRTLEPAVRVAFTALLDSIKPSVFWDVGANIGYYSWFIRRCPSVEQVVMFEPDPTNFHLIEATIRMNAISACHVFNVALSDQTGEATFVVDSVSGAVGSLEATAPGENPASLHHAYQLQNLIRCRTDTVDHLLASGARSPELIKIDVEGAEQLVVAGAAQCLRQRRPALVVESRSDLLIERLRSFDYVPVQIDEQNCVFIPAENERVLEALKRALPKGAR